jgi:hypothetical protein
MSSKCGEGADDTHRRCIKERTDTIERCADERDEGYDSCVEERRDRIRQCCDWWPCSWACRIVYIIISVVCIAWEWISNVVCVLWEYLKRVVCTAWFVLTKVGCVVLDAAATLLGALVALVETVFGWILSVAGFIISILTSIPFIGRIIGWVIELVHTVVNGIISLPDAALTLLGIMPEKKLRLAVIVLQDSDHTPMASDDVIARAIAYSIRTFREEVNVRVIPLAYANYRTAYAGDDESAGSFIYHDDTASSGRLLDVCCDACAAGDDLGSIGADFNMKMSRTTFWGNARRLIGYGAPIVAFTVRSFTDGKAGCSLGPLTDWVTVRFTDSDTTLTIDQLTPDRLLGSITDLGHELGHCCNLPNYDDKNRLMIGTPPPKVGMTTWHKVLFSDSRHVTYF